jgi:hypothetical protein
MPSATSLSSHHCSDTPGHHDDLLSVAVPSTNGTALRELLAHGLIPTTGNTFLASRPLGDGARYLSSGGALG